MTVRLDEGVLHRLFRILDVSQHGESYADTRRSCFRTSGSKARRSPASTKLISARSSSPPVPGIWAYSLIRNNETGPRKEKIQDTSRSCRSSLNLFALNTCHMVGTWKSGGLEMRPKDKWLPISRKRHKIGQLDFRSFRRLTGRL